MLYMVELAFESVDEIRIYNAGFYSPVMADQQASKIGDYE